MIGLMGGRVSTRCAATVALFAVLSLHAAAAREFAISYKQGAVFLSHAMIVRGEYTVEASNAVPTRIVATPMEGKVVLGPNLHYAKFVLHAAYWVDGKIRLISASSPGSKPIDWPGCELNFQDDGSNARTLLGGQSCSIDVPPGTPVSPDDIFLYGMIFVDSGGYFPLTPLDNPAN